MASEPPSGQVLELLRRLAETNPLVRATMPVDHGQTLARVTYVATAPAAGAGSGNPPRNVTDTLTVAPGFGEEPGSCGEAASARELARHAVAAYGCRSWQIPVAGRAAVELGGRPRIMGILNVTEDSFSDGGRWSAPDAAIARGLEMVEEGADWIDVGGESTRPGAASVGVQIELDRVIPVVSGLVARTGAAVSIDTSKAAVAREAVAAGAAIVNDVTALRGDPEMGRAVAETGAALVLMHMLGTPQTMQSDPSYADVTTEVAIFLRQALVRAAEAGIQPGATLIDPGIGFGKTLEHNLSLVQRLEELCSLGRPILLGASRKSFLGRLLDQEVGERDEASAVCHGIGALRGAAVVRVHDVARTARMLRLVNAIGESGAG